MKFIISLLLNGLVVFIASAILSGVQVDGYTTAIIVAILLAVVNTFIRPVIRFLTFPITLLTLGLFLLVINGGMVLLVDALLSGFTVNGLIWAILFSIVLSLFNLLTGGIQLKDDRAYA